MKIVKSDLIHYPGQDPQPLHASDCHHFSSINACNLQTCRLCLPHPNHFEPSTFLSQSASLTASLASGKAAKEAGSFMVIPKPWRWTTNRWSHTIQAQGSWKTPHWQIYSQVAFFHVSETDKLQPRRTAEVGM